MKIATSFGLLLAAVVLGAPQLALADPPPLTQVLQDFQDVGKAMERLEHEKAEAEAARTKAQAELDDLKRQNPQARGDAEGIQRRIDEAEEKIKRIDLIVEGKKRDQHEQPSGHADGPNSDIARELDKLAEERERAKADLDRAKAELDGAKQGRSQQREKVEALERQIREDEEKIGRADERLGRIPERQLEFKATNEDEVKLALHLPEVLQKIIDALGSHRLNDKFTAEPYFDPGNNAGGIRLHWKGNP
jgi:chromosome segregation ATPase